MFNLLQNNNPHQSKSVVPKRNEYSTITDKRGVFVTSKQLIAV